MVIGEENLLFGGVLAAFLLGLETFFLALGEFGCSLDQFGAYQFQLAEFGSVAFAEG